jgi:hypothetical protein
MITVSDCETWPGSISTKTERCNRLTDKISRRDRFEVQNYSGQTPQRTFLDGYGLADAQIFPRMRG